MSTRNFYRDDRHDLRVHWAISLMTLEEASQSLLLQIDQYLTRRGMRVKISKAMCSIKIEE